ncbi:restriction endonuclease subunit S [Deinococcus pimensis]|uniref:restriction endonuclease subunit S n=1 Tax=Deinococcus pimensis TaxID=309888 RepID=UPI000A039071|nr:restriction endonuclease subunit S [Deinococcus pimensis]
MTDVAEQPARSETGLAPGWQWATLAALGEVTGGLTKNAKRGSFELKLPYLRVANVYANSLKLDDVEEVGVLPTEIARTLLKKNDLLVVEGNGSPDHIGRVALWDGSIETCLHQNHLIKVRLAGTAPKFVLYWLLSKEGRAYIRSVSSSSSGLYTLSIGKVEGLPVPVAPIQEQERIVARIEELLSKLDSGTAALHKTKALLKLYRQSVLHAGVSGQLTQVWRKQQGEQLESADVQLERVLQQRREAWEASEKKGKYKEPKGPSETNLPSVPQGWVWTTFEQASYRVTVGFVGQMKHEYRDEGVPFLRSQNVRPNRYEPEGLRYISNQFHDRISKSEVRSGDLVVVRSGSVGTACAIPEDFGEGNCSDLVIVQRPYFNAKFAAYYMNSMARANVSARKVGIGLEHFNTSALASMALPFPTVAEQAQIVAEVERRLSVLDKLEVTVNSELKRAKQTRQGILRKAFRGELIPQDPNDEPTSVLLERIKAEKIRLGVENLRRGRKPRKENK